MIAKSAGNILYWIVIVNAEEPPPRGSFLLPKTDESEVRSMARAPDPRIEKAKVMYLEGMRLVEIASQLNLLEGTVRRWKSTHKWENERSDKKSERSEKRKRGAQPGNKNSSGGPPGNKKAVTTGEFETLLLIAWNRRSGVWRRRFRKINRRYPCRRSSSLRFGNAGC